MSKSFQSRVASFVSVLVFALIATAVQPAFAQNDDDGPDGETAAEMLTDGLDAAADHAPESARRLFDRLIAAFPNSPEAARARRAIANLGRSDGAGDADDREAIRADEAERTAQYRHIFLVDVGDRVFFAENSAIIGGRARSIIEGQARWLKSRPDLSVTLIGRADDGGDKNAARTLSQQRAEAVRDRLVAAGLGRDRVEIKATGDQDRLALCTSALCQAQNRNVEVLINDWRSDAGWQSSQEAPTRSSRTPLGAAGSGQSPSEQVP